MEQKLAFYVHGARLPVVIRLGHTEHAISLAQAAVLVHDLMAALVLAGNILARLREARTLGERGGG